MDGAAAETAAGLAAGADAKDHFRKGMEVHCGKEIADMQLVLTKDGPQAADISQTLTAA